MVGISRCHTLRAACVSGARIIQSAWQGMLSL